MLNGVVHPPVRVTNAWVLVFLDPWVRMQVRAYVGKAASMLHFSRVLQGIADPDGNP